MYTFALEINTLRTNLIHPLFYEIQEATVDEDVEFEDEEEEQMHNGQMHNGNGELVQIQT